MNGSAEEGSLVHDRGAIQRLEELECPGRAGSGIVCLGGRGMNPKGPLWVQVLGYLRAYDPEQCYYMAPFDLTQDGIAEALEISRAHAALLLKRMADRGLTESSLAYIQGRKRRRLAYRLTHFGLSVSREKYF